MNLKTKGFSLSVVLLTGLYIFLESSKIFPTLGSGIWFRDFDLFNHASNFNVHLVIISGILLNCSILLLLALLLKLDIKLWIVVIINLLAFVLLVNAAIIPIYWMEINIFGGAILLLFAVVLLVQFFYRLYRGTRGSSGG